MSFKEVIRYYKTINKNGINAFQEEISPVSIQKVVEEALKGNYHLNLVISEDIVVTEKDFVVAALNALEFDLYDISEEISSYEIKDYSYNDFVNETWFPFTKEILIEHNIVEENCSSIYKLRERDELTFLVKTKTQYVFIQEIYWRS